jgi:hypothetical protein
MRKSAGKHGKTGKDHPLASHGRMLAPWLDLTFAKTTKRKKNDENLQGKRLQSILRKEPFRLRNDRRMEKDKQHAREVRAYVLCRGGLRERLAQIRR